MYNTVTNHHIVILYSQNNQMLLYNLLFQYHHYYSPFVYCIQFEYTKQIMKGMIIPFKADKFGFCLDKALSKQKTH
jgi:hypothetical protein